MNNDHAPFEDTVTSSLIGEHGFTAILRDDDINERFSGILGAPRIAPTRAGLFIEDSYGAAIDSIILDLLEDFARQEQFAAPRESTDSDGARQRRMASVEAHERCFADLIAS